MLKYRSTVARKGQVTIPKEFRDEFGLSEGDKVEWSREDDKIVLRPVGSVVERTYGSLGPFAKRRFTSYEDEKTRTGRGNFWRLVGDREAHVMRPDFFIDTNVFVRHALNDHSEHSPLARALISSIDSGEVIAETSATVIFETVHVLHKVYGIERANVADTLRESRSNAGSSHSESVPDSSGVQSLA